jgi:hypothetical protein
MATLRQWGTDFGMLSRTAKVLPSRWSACRQNRTGRLRAGVVFYDSAEPARNAATAACTVG